ncbi:Chanoclavine-I aldehyde reductase fgaOx3 [Paramyrothecium foliicola]|nr:Chanoclavine-I aldehyde reductase fgaOx3 [Paramyrothecium foliicola]
MASDSRLFQPLQVGKMNLQHRLALAPLTRFRSDDDHVPLPFMADYYRQRGSVPGTLLITEGTFIHHKAGGFPNVPGIWNEEQVAAWKKITDTVHAEGSYIVCQLWALGRAAAAKPCHSEVDPVSASAKPLPDCAMPHALTLDEIDDYVSYYVQAAKNAIAAGFDGVEVHGANGYLIDQFTQDVSNERTDEYGGSIENRSRFGLRVAKAVVEAVGADRVGFRLSPYSPFQGMRMNDPKPQFTHMISGLRDLELAYIHIVEPRISGNADVDGDKAENVEWAVEAWGRERVTIIAGGFKPETALERVDKTYADYNVVVAFGRYFISTPDLPYRLKEGLALEPYDRSTFYINKSEKGYTDYPFHPSFAKSTAKI